MKTSFESARTTPRLLVLYARFLVVAVILLLVAGALVTSTGSGLAVPDWPLSYGQLMPPMEGGVLFEHGHRMVATAVGALTVLLALWIQRVEPRRWVRQLGWTAVGMVILQGVLGGVTVLLRLPVLTSAAHACLAQGFMLLVVFLALVLSPGWREPGTPLGTRHPLPVLAFLTTALVYVQLILGAVTRHLHAALVFPDFPLVEGGLVPSTWSTPVAVHYAHRVGALIVAISVLATGISALRLPSTHPSLRRPGGVLILLTAVQILLGGGIVWSGRHVAIATAHVVVGALLLATSLVLAIRSRRVAAAPSPRQAVHRTPSSEIAGGVTA